jgi:hypothetical protein
MPSAKFENNIKTRAMRFSPTRNAPRGKRNAKSADGRPIFCRFL